MAEHFTGAGFEVLAMDLRGHGKSSGPKGHSPSYETLMDDIDLLLEKVREMFIGKPIFLLGHSMGGNLVLNYVLRRNPGLAGVIVMSPLLLPKIPTPAAKLFLARVMSALSPTTTFHIGIKPEQKTHDLDELKVILEDPLVSYRVSARLGIDALRAGEWLLEHAREFKLPLLMMQGSGDMVTSIEATGRFVESVEGPCTFKVWDGLYHELHSERERLEVFAFIVDWMKGRLQEL